jgi:hypothetical protein
MTTFRRGAAALAAGFMVAAGATTTASAMPSENTNDPGYWEAVLMEEGYLDVSCEKVEGDYSAYGDYEQIDVDGDGELDAWAFYPYEAWLAVIIKAGATGTSVEDENTPYFFVEAGDELMHDSGKEISHIIFCDGTVPEEPEEPVEEPEEPVEEPEEPVEEPEEPVEEPEEPTTPGKPGDDAGKPIGPIVQTDVPATGVNPALPLAAIAAAGLGLAAVGLRRRGDNGAS